MRNGDTPDQAAQGALAPAPVFLDEYRLFTEADPGPSLAEGPFADKIGELAAAGRRAAALPDVLRAGDLGARTQVASLAEVGRPAHVARHHRDR